MSKLQKFRVVRPHDGDRWYDENEIRTGRLVDLKHLVPGTLEHLGDADEDDDDEQPGDAAADDAGEKADAEYPNKAEAAAPANKAEKKPANKGARGA